MLAFDAVHVCIIFSSIATVCAVVLVCDESVANSEAVALTSYECKQFP